MTALNPVEAAIAEARARAGVAAPTTGTPASAPAPAAPAIPVAPPGFRYDAATNSFVPDVAPALPPAPPGYRLDPATNSYVPNVAPAAPAPAAPAAPAAPVVAPAAYNPPAPVAASGPTSVAAYDPNQYQAGRKLTMAEMMAGRSKLSVDYFLGVDESGIKVRFMRDDPKGLQFAGKLAHSVLLDVNFASDVRLCFGVRYEDPITKEVTYARTGDRVFADDGTPWQTVIAKAMQTDKSCRGDYPSADIAGVLAQPLVAMDGTQVLPAGARVGFSTSVTNWTAFQRCFDGMLGANLIEDDGQGGFQGRVYLKVGFKAMQNKQNKHYGIFTFECAGEIGEVEVLAAPPQPAPAIAAQAGGTVIDVPAEAPRKRTRAKAEPAAAPAVPAGMPPAPPGFRYDAATNSFVPV